MTDSGIPNQSLIQALARCKMLLWAMLITRSARGHPPLGMLVPLAIPHMLESSQVLFFVFLHLPVCSVRHRVCAICFCRSASALVCHQDSINSQTPTPSEQEGALVQVSAS